MREELHKIEELAEGSLLDLHGCMFAIEDDTVLIEIHVRRILEAPLGIVNRDRNDPVILTGGMVHAAAIALGSFSGLERLMVMSRVP